MINSQASALRHIFIWNSTMITRSSTKVGTLAFDGADSRGFRLRGACTFGLLWWAIVLADGSRWRLSA